MALYGLTDTDRRAIADSLRRDFAGKVSRRPVPRRWRPFTETSDAGGSPATSTNCHLVTATNIGPDCPAGGVRMVVDDQHTEDRTVRRDCGAAATAVEIVAFYRAEDRVALPAEWGNQSGRVYFTAPGSVRETDLLVLFGANVDNGQQQLPRPTGTNDDFGAAGGTPGDPATVAWVWGDQLTDGRLYTNTGYPGSGYPGTPASGLAVAVLRNVKRYPTNGVGGYSDRGVVRNGVLAFSRVFELGDDPEDPGELAMLEVDYAEGSAAATSGEFSGVPAATAFLRVQHADVTQIQGQGDAPASAFGADYEFVFSQIGSVGGAQNEDERVYVGLQQSQGAFNPVFRNVVTGGEGQFSERGLLLGLEFEATVSTAPDSTCNALVVDEHSPNTFLETDDAAGRSAARKRLTTSRQRRPVIATTAIGNGVSGSWVYAGIVPAWVYVRDENHEWADLGPVNRRRERLYDSGELAEVSGEVGVFGEYYKASHALATGQDPASLEFFWRNDWLVSGSRGRCRILRRYDIPESATAAITIEVETTGSDITVRDAASNVYAQGNPASSGGSVTFNVDLTQHYAGLRTPVYGDGETYSEAVASDDAAVTGTLLGVEGGRLAITYTNAWAATGTSGTPVTATFTIGSNAALADDDASRFSTCHPMVYTETDFPETVQALPEPRALGSTLTIADAYPTPPSAAILENYDPWLGRVPGSDADLRTTDNRVGWKRCLIEVIGNEPDAPAPGVVACC